MEPVEGGNWWKIAFTFHIMAKSSATAYIHGIWQWLIPHLLPLKKHALSVECAYLKCSLEKLRYQPIAISSVWSAYMQGWNYWDIIISDMRHLSSLYDVYNKSNGYVCLQWSILISLLTYLWPLVSTLPFSNFVQPSVIALVSLPSCNTWPVLNSRQRNS